MKRKMYLLLTQLVWQMISKHSTNLILCVLTFTSFCGVNGQFGDDFCIPSKVSAASGILVPIKDYMPLLLIAAVAFGIYCIKKNMIHNSF